MYSKGKILLIICVELFVLQFHIWGQDYPASPLHKEGYRLIFHDEFDGKTIDRSKWILEYLPSWPKDRSVCRPTYEMKDGIIKLIIDKDSKNEFDKGMYISGFMSASRTGMHHYDPKRKALHSIKTEATQINQYGYYEMRAKMHIGGGVHCAWWLIGFEDDPNQSCEIDIFGFVSDLIVLWCLDFFFESSGSIAPELTSSALSIAFVNIFIPRAKIKEEPTIFSQYKTTSLLNLFISFSDIKKSCNGSNSGKYTACEFMCIKESGLHLEFLILSKS